MLHTPDWWPRTDVHVEAPSQIRVSSLDPCTPLTHEREQHFPDAVAHASNYPPEQPAEEAKSGSMVYCSMLQASHVFPGEIVQGKPDGTSEYLDEGMQQVVIMGIGYEVMHVLL